MPTVLVVDEGGAGNAEALATALRRLLPDPITVHVGHGLPGRDRTDAQATLRGQPAAHERSGSLVAWPCSATGAAGPRPSCVVWIPHPAHTARTGDAVTGVDVVQGSRVDRRTLSSIALRLGISTRAARELAWMSGARPRPATAVVLAGGRSSRMGIDKAWLEIQGERLIDRVCRQLRPWFDRILVSARTESLRVEGADTVLDRRPGRGPLAGIEAGLAASRTERNFVVAGDVPDIHLPTVFALLAALEAGDASYLSFGPGSLEPLFAGYRRRVAWLAGQLIDEGSLRAASLADRCRSTIVPCDDRQWYVNLNSPDDLGRFQRGASMTHRPMPLQPGGRK